MIAPEIRSKLTPDAFILPRAQSNTVSPIGCAMGKTISILGGRFRCLSLVALDDRYRKTALR